MEIFPLDDAEHIAILTKALDTIAHVVREWNRGNEGDVDALIMIEEQLSFLGYETGGID